MWQNKCEKEAAAVTNLNECILSGTRVRPWGIQRQWWTKWLLPWQRSPRRNSDQVVGESSFLPGVAWQNRRLNDNSSKRWHFYSCSQRVLLGWWSVTVAHSAVVSVGGVYKTRLCQNGEESSTCKHGVFGMTSRVCEAASCIHSEVGMSWNILTQPGAKKSSTRMTCPTQQLPFSQSRRSKNLEFISSYECLLQEVLTISPHWLNDHQDRESPDPRNKINICGINSDSDVKKSRAEVTGGNCCFIPTRTRGKAVLSSAHGLLKSPWPTAGLSHSQTLACFGARPWMFLDRNFLCLWGRVLNHISVLATEKQLCVVIKRMNNLLQVPLRSSSDL